MKTLEPLLQKDVTRKEFLTLIGFGLASLFGMNRILALITGKGSSERIRHFSSGYSSSDYGGKQMLNQR
jgi:hypothetical protein